MDTKATSIMNDPAGEAGFCIDDFSDTLTTEYVVKNPKDGTPTDIKLTLAGPEHPLQKKRQFARLRKMRADVASKGKIQFDDPVQEEEDEDKFLASIILGWNKMPRRNGNLAYSAGAALELMTDPQRRWLREQVAKAIGERDAFIASCAGS